MTAMRAMTETTIVEELRAGRAVTYFTNGVSMRPLLRTAETHVHILPLSAEGAEAYLPQGIVLYVRPTGKLVLHRLIKQEGDVYYMRGDNTYGLEPIRREQMIGVVDTVWRKGRYIDVATDRHYLGYVRRRLKNYPARYLAYRVKSKLRRALRIGARAEAK